MGRRIPTLAALIRTPALVSVLPAVYTKSDSDGEYAGFTISGHLLRNESLLFRGDPEFS